MADISEREKRLRNRNINKGEKVRFLLKKRSEMTEEELEPERLLIEQIVAQNSKRRARNAKRKAERFEKEKEEPWPPEWKPIKESIQYNCGLIVPFVDDLWGIMNMDANDFNTNPQYAKWANDDPGLLNRLKSFITLVRNSSGYDVNWVPPSCMSSPFYPIDDVSKEMKDREYKKFINPMLKCVVERINARAKDHGEEYKPPFKIKKIVEALPYRKCLITFSGNLVSDGGRVEAVKDVQAMLHLEGGDSYDCVEWRFIPNEPGFLRKAEF